MVAFRVASCLLPTVAALWISMDLTRGAVRNSGVLRIVLVNQGVLLLILLGFGLAAGASASSLGAVALFSLAAALLSAGLHLLFRGAFRSPAAAQIGCSLVAVGLMTSVFLLGPIVKRGRESGVDGAVLAQQIQYAIIANPYAVISHSVFGEDVLRRPQLYATEAADYVPPEIVPEWWQTAAGYAGLGIVLGSLGLGLLSLRRRAGTPT